MFIGYKYHSWLRKRIQLIFRKDCSFIIPNNRWNSSKHLSLIMKKFLVTFSTSWKFKLRPACADLRAQFVFINFQFLVAKSYFPFHFDSQNGTNIFCACIDVRRQLAIQESTFGCCFCSISILNFLCHRHSFSFLPTWSRFSRNG